LKLVTDFDFGDSISQVGAKVLDFGNYDRIILANYFIEIAAATFAIFLVTILLDVIQFLLIPKMWIRQLSLKVGGYCS